MKPSPSSHVRIARPSRDLRATERFWVDGLGLEALYRADSSAEGGHALLMAGWPDTAWHLEFVDDREGETPAAPTEEEGKAQAFIDVEKQALSARSRESARAASEPARRNHHICGVMNPLHGIGGGAGCVTDLSLSISRRRALTWIP